MNIALIGKAGSGKDTLADYLVTRYGYTRLAFADKVKEIARDLFGMESKDRALLQAIGVKMREVRPTVWLDYIFRKAETGGPYVITDCRFKNEYDACKKRRWTAVRVITRDGVRFTRLQQRDGEFDPGAMGHISETDLDGVHSDYLITNNGSLEELHLKANALMALPPWEVRDAWFLGLTTELFLWTG